MGDDINLIIPQPEPEPEPEPETSYEAIGEALLARLDEISYWRGNIDATLVEIQARLSELAGREYAAIEHTHTEYSLIGHDHDDRYAKIEDVERPPEKRPPDRAPEKQHPYFRKIGEF